ncbi:MAG: phosphodiester glycosidase family protein [Acidimicrobiales bacterium]
MTLANPMPPIERSTSPTPTGPTHPRSRRRRTVLRSVLAAVGIAVVAALGTAWWALDRFVIDHVEIADVAAYESSVLDATTDAAASSTPADTSGSSDPVEAGEATITATSYQAGGTSIEISTVVTGSGSDTVTYYVADVVVDDATKVRAGFADNSFGTNIVANTSDIAESYDAVFAINGDYYGFRDSGIVIRNGVAYRDDGIRTGLVMYVDGTMAVYDETATSADELLAAGAWNTWSFGPAIVDDGAVLDGIEDVEVDTNFGNHSIQGVQPRTGIGVIDDNHFVFVVVDGRSTGYSRGVTMTEFADIFVELGATTAYNLDGGGSSTIYFDGELVNNPLGKNRERGTSDIIYIG